MPPVHLEWEPHEGQRRLIRNKKRFNFVNCGRRFGKTSLGTFLLMAGVSTGKPVAWFSPSYKDLNEIWKIVKRSLTDAGLVRSKSEQLKQLELVNGTVIDFWSLSDIDSGRGRKYALIIVDEVAKIKNFQEAWRNTLRATLSDYEGDAWLFSTPKGRNNDWYKMCTNLGPGSAYFEAKTSDNPYIPKKEIAAAKAELPPTNFAQEYEAKFVDFAEGLFLNEWDDDFLLKGEDQISIATNLPLYLSFDFNVDPTTALLYQIYDEPGGCGFCFLDEVQVKGGTKRLCEELEVYKDHPGLLMVTGDYSGNTGSTVGGLQAGGEYNTDYTIILEELEILESQLVDTREVNKRHVLSRSLCNYALHNELIWVNECCTQLVSDITTAVPTASGKLLKDRAFHKNDALDAFRYAVHTMCNDGVNSLRELKEIVNTNK